MLSEYITSLADVIFHIVAYMYARFRYSGKNPMPFAVFWRISVRFSDPPYASLKLNDFIMTKDKTDVSVICLLFCFIFIYVIAWEIKVSKG